MKWKYRCKTCGSEFEADSDCCGKDINIYCSSCRGTEVEEIQVKNEDDFRSFVARFMTYGGG